MLRRTERYHQKCQNCQKIAEEHPKISDSYVHYYQRKVTLGTVNPDTSIESLPCVEKHCVQALLISVFFQFECDNFNNYLLLSNTLILLSNSSFKIFRL